MRKTRRAKAKAGLEKKRPGRKLRGEIWARLLVRVAGGLNAGSSGSLGMTPMMSAGLCGTKRTGASAVRWLLKEGASAAKRDSEGLTALHWAARAGNAQACRAILGANPNLAQARGKKGETFLMTAVFGRASIADMLQMVKMVPKKALLARDVHGRSLAHMLCSAVGLRSKRVLRCVLNRAPGLANARDRAGARPLHKVMGAQDGGRFGLGLDRKAAWGLMLVSFGALWEVKDHQGCSPLDLAQALRGAGWAGQLRSRFEEQALASALAQAGGAKRARSKTIRV